MCIMSFNDLNLKLLLNVLVNRKLADIILPKLMVGGSADEGF